MNDNIKLIIEISEHQYEICKQALKDPKRRPITECEFAIAVGTPLDNDSERAETQAYFAGEAYGWEQGRKALIEDLKAEIKEKCDRIDDIARANIYQYAPHREIQDLLCEILTSIDNGKGEIINAEET